MPIHTGQDKNGKFYQWGKTGKKYYFKPEDKQSKQRALNKAKKQQTAIYSSGWKGDTMKLLKVKKKDSYTGQKRFGLVDVFLKDNGECDIRLEGRGIVSYEEAIEIMKKKQKEVHDLEVACRFAYAEMRANGVR